MKLNISREDEQKIIEALYKEDVVFEEPETVEDVTSIFVTGDWKHGHGHIDYVMGKLGYRPLLEVVEGYDDCDWYSSTHYYCKTLSSRKRLNLNWFERKLKERFKKFSEAIKNGEIKLTLVDKP